MKCIIYSKNRREWIKFRDCDYNEPLGKAMLLKTWIEIRSKSNECDKQTAIDFCKENKEFVW